MNMKPLIATLLFLSGCEAEPTYTQCNFKAGDVVKFKDGKTSVVKSITPDGNHRGWSQCVIYLVGFYSAMTNSELLITTIKSKEVVK